jgi:hypothetical protein
MTKKIQFQLEFKNDVSNVCQFQITMRKGETNESVVKMMFKHGEPEVKHEVFHFSLCSIEGKSRAKFTAWINDHFETFVVESNIEVRISSQTQFTFAKNATRNDSVTFQQRFQKAENEIELVKFFALTLSKTGDLMDAKRFLEWILSEIVPVYEQIVSTQTFCFKCKVSCGPIVLYMDAKNHYCHRCSIPDLELFFMDLQSKSNAETILALLKRFQFLNQHTVSAKAPWEFPKSETYETTNSDMANFPTEIQKNALEMKPPGKNPYVMYTITEDVENKKLKFEILELVKTLPGYVSTEHQPQGYNLLFLESHDGKQKRNQKGVTKGNQKGVTNVHMDWADAYNWMIPSSKGSAVWYFIRADMLTCKDVQRLIKDDWNDFLYFDLQKQYPNKIFSLDQKPQQRVYIPSGWIHRVVTYGKTFKIAQDFATDEKLSTHSTMLRYPVEFQLCGDLLMDDFMDLQALAIRKLT